MRCESTPVTGAMYGPAFKVFTDAIGDAYVTVCSVRFQLLGRELQGLDPAPDLSLCVQAITNLIHVVQCVQF